MAGEKPMAAWSDADIIRVLREHGEAMVPITATTRSFLLKKVKRLLTKSSEDTRDGEGAEPSADSETVARKTPSGEEKFEGYYGVAGLNEGGGLGPSAPPSPSVYTSRAAVLKVIKSTPGARFKKFDSQESAEAFSRLQLSPSTAATASAPPLAEERANAYPAPKTADLSKLLLAIERGDVDAFTATVKSNPRYLITPSDTPQVSLPRVFHDRCINTDTVDALCYVHVHRERGDSFIKLHVACKVPLLPLSKSCATLHASCPHQQILMEGFRYNAMHCAIRMGQEAIVRELFSILSSQEFWEEVYPRDSTEIREDRKTQLVDLYLNLPDGKEYQQFNTPLHHACAFGHVGIVSFLLSFPSLNLLARNKESKTPMDVVCERAPSSAEGDTDRLKVEILTLLRGLKHSHS